MFDFGKRTVKKRAAFVLILRSHMSNHVKHKRYITQYRNITGATGDVSSHCDHSPQTAPHTIIRRDVRA